MTEKCDVTISLRIETEPGQETHEALQGILEEVKSIESPTLQNGPLLRSSRRSTLKSKKTERNFDINGTSLSILISLSFKPPPSFEESSSQ